MPRGLVAAVALLAYILSVSGSPPKFIRPCIPAGRKSVPHGAGWLHEPKLDGYRLQVVKEGHLVRLYSKGGYDWTKRLARLAEALMGIPCQSAVIDAELVFPGTGGVPDFGGLRTALGTREQDELAVFAFDLMHCDGVDLTALPLADRRRRLRTIARQIGSAVPAPRYAPLGSFETVLNTAAAHHRLLWIHPFLDGNGRMARLISYAMLRNAPRHLRPVVRGARSRP